MPFHFPSILSISNIVWVLAQFGNHMHSCFSMFVDCCVIHQPGTELKYMRDHGA